MKISQLPVGVIPDYSVVRLFFSFFLLLSPYKTIAFHNATNGGCLNGRIVIDISLMYNQNIVWQ